MIDNMTLATLLFAPGLNRRGLRPLLWGEPGTGKTAGFEAVAEGSNAILFTLIASQNDPTDFGGMPVFTGKGGMTYALPDWLLKADALAEAGEIVVIFFDELTTCTPAVQASLLRLVNEGEVRGHVLHKNVIFAAAANPPECAAGGYPLAPPTSNRWLHIEWEGLDVDDWISGVLSNWAKPREELVDVKEMVAMFDSERYQQEYVRAKGLVTSFMASVRTRGLHKMPKKGDAQASRAWASRRTWELTMRVLAAANTIGLSETTIDQLVAGYVGEGIAAEFLQYQLAADLPNIAELLDAPDYKKVFEVDSRRPDRTHAVLNGIAALIVPADCPKRKTRVTRAWEIIGDIADEQADIAMQATRELLTSSPPAVCPKTSRTQVLRFQKVLTEMGALKG